MSYVNLVSRWRKFVLNATRVLAVKKVFKKKNCGALAGTDKDFYLTNGVKMIYKGKVYGKFDHWVREAL